VIGVLSSPWFLRALEAFCCCEGVLEVAGDRDLRGAGALIWRSWSYLLGTVDLLRGALCWPLESLPIT
jgi:hypothetical protein